MARIPLSAQIGTLTIGSADAGGIWLGGGAILPWGSLIFGFGIEGSDWATLLSDGEGLLGDMDVIELPDVGFEGFWSKDCPLCVEFIEEFTAGWDDAFPLLPPEPFDD